MKTNYKLLEFMINNGLERYYAAFLKLKHVHINSTIYNYSDKRIAKEANISRASAKKYTQFFIENKWVKLRGKDLIFIAHNKLKYIYLDKIENKCKDRSNFQLKAKNNELQTIVKTLRYEILKNKQRQHSFINGIKANLNNPVNLKAYKSAKKFQRKYRVQEGKCKQTLTATTKTIGVWINKSSATASRLIKEMGATVIKGRIIKTVKMASKVELPNNMFQYKRFVFLCEPNQYIF